MDLTSPGLLEDLERKPLQFGYPRFLRWILFLGGVLFFGIAFYLLIPDCLDVTSGTLCRPLVNYVYAAILLVFAVLSTAMALRWGQGWNVTLDANGLEVWCRSQAPIRISWDQIADVRRSWTGRVIVSTREGRHIAAFDSNFGDSDKLEAFLSGVAWIGRQVPFRGRRFADALRAAVHSTTLIFKALASDGRERRSKGYGTLMGVSLLVAMVALLFVFEIESLETRIFYSGMLIFGAIQLLYAHWRRGRNYGDTIEVTRHGVTSRSETGATTFLSWNDLAAAELKETAAGAEIHSADGNRILRVGELKHGPLFWQAFWLMGGARPSDA